MVLRQKDEVRIDIFNATACLRGPAYSLSTDAPT
jgi:hypothetical protein